MPTPPIAGRWPSRKPFRSWNLARSLLRPGRCRPNFRNARRAFSIGAGRTGSGSAVWAMSDWAQHFCRFEPLPGNLKKPLALRYHGHQFRVYNPDIGDGRGFLFAQLRDDRRPPARSRHQGQRPDALQPPRRRAADAEGRRARGAGDRDAGGAGRQYVEELRPVRDRRGAVARRRALAHPLVGADPAQPRPYPHRQFPALRLFRRCRRRSPR